MFGVGASRVGVAHFNARLGCALQMSLGHNRDMQGRSPKRSWERTGCAQDERRLGFRRGGDNDRGAVKVEAATQPEIQKQQSRRAPRLNRKAVCRFREICGSGEVARGSWAKGGILKISFYK
jgi:hypothetical protein